MKNTIKDTLSCEITESLDDLVGQLQRGKVSMKDVAASLTSISEHLNKSMDETENNPYLNEGEELISEELFELKQWIITDWLDGRDTTDDEYLKYCQLNDALEILEEDKIKRNKIIDLIKNEKL